MSYKALALQLTCQTINYCQTRDESEAAMLQTIERIERQIAASVGLLGRDTLLVVVPEFFLTGPPVDETVDQWREKAALDIDGRIYEALGAMVQRQQIYFSGNAYEQDPFFPELYFQTNFIIGPSGDVLLRYRRLNAMFTPTPHDVWELYLDAYGYDSLFPVVKTNIGNLACITSEDILFPEVARCLAMRGAEVLIHSTAEIGSPLLTQKNIAKQARAIENMAYVVSANSGGILGSVLPGNTTDGGSKIIDPRGTVLAEAAYGESIVANADIDLAALREFRQRPAAGNLLARQRLELYTESYNQRVVFPPNTLLSQPAERQHFMRTQQDVIKKLYS
ncbi:nitrilase-related carbon-nitrogen hydrolase [Spirosoma linguale]|uniref:Nitrilase/cyanide hydratase and apolipoprotein N-acyltransferase n=1 Tax=Spirosoma linguale (strain ATCC 33905 / DSM 74 / LMG 10896 / Claus 1) TaxID=504472 RepID=D2QGB8_SPILD|nr:Nitrilase/cyanide hydratase and apolipoprotein N- acyltransferase [Spirosoma linguale DSM 74]